jgi:hypothetical protein
MIGHGEIEPERADDRPDETLGLAHSKAEHGAQRQCRRDRQRGIARLTAGSAAPLSIPGGDSRLGEPNRQAAALAQRCSVFRPVRHPISPLRDMMTAILVRFERHGGFPGLRVPFT